MIGQFLFHFILFIPFYSIYFYLIYHKLELYQHFEKEVISWKMIQQFFSILFLFIPFYSISFHSILFRFFLFDLQLIWFISAFRKRSNQSKNYSTNFIPFYSISFYLTYHKFELFFNNFSVPLFVSSCRAWKSANEIPFILEAATAEAAEPKRPSRAIHGGWCYSNDEASSCLLHTDLSLMHTNCWMVRPNLT